MIDKLDILSHLFDKIFIPNAVWEELNRSNFSRNFPQAKSFANFLVIDDKKARLIAEELGINCIGTLAVLVKAKEKGLINALKPVFEMLLKNRRYYSKSVLNKILSRHRESFL